jgi:hypothetical protein
MQLQAWDDATAASFRNSAAGRISLRFLADANMLIMGPVGVGRTLLPTAVARMSNQTAGKTSSGLCGRSHCRVVSQLTPFSRAGSGQPSTRCRLGSLGESACL